jgi:hypothetical protein
MVTLVHIVDHCSNSADQTIVTVIGHEHFATGVLIERVPVGVQQRPLHESEGQGRLGISKADLFLDAIEYPMAAASVYWLDTYHVAGTVGFNQSSQVVG